MMDSRIGTLAVHLLKGFVQRDDHPKRFEDLLQVRAGVIDYLAVIGLDLVIDEPEGFAYVRQRTSRDGDEDGIPRLSVKRPLGFTTSMLLALLRRRLAEHEASSGEPRLVLPRDQIIELVRGFVPNTGDDTKIINQVDSSIEQVVKMGFLRPVPDRNDYEVRRIIIAFITAQWLDNLNNNLEAYRRRFAPESP